MKWRRESWLVLWLGFATQGAAGAAASASWSSVSTDNSPFDAFGFHSASAYGSQIVMFGGQNDNGLLNTLRVYDTATGTWEEPLTSGEVPEARALHSGVVVGSELMIWAGYDGETPFKDFRVLDLGSWKWSAPQLSGTPPAPREGHTAVLVDSEIVVFGGADGEQWFDDVHLLDKDQLSWSQPRVRGTSPKAREGHSATAYGEAKMIVFGGTNGEECFNQVHEFDISALEWRLLSTSGQAPAPRVFHSASLISDSLFVFAGHNGEDRFNDLFRLDLKANQWHTTPASGFAPSPRLCHSATSFPGSSKIWVVGGFDGSDLHKSLHVLETNVNTPSSQPEASKPKEVAAAAAVETPKPAAADVETLKPAAAKVDSKPANSLMSVWSDVYADAPSSSGPTVAFHSATKLGDKLLVFGGQTSDEFSDDTHIWDGSGWTTPKFGVRPTPRAMHSAVLLSTGAFAGNLVVFGGYDGEKAHADLWALDTKGEMSWKNLEGVTEGAVPSPRQGHCSVVSSIDGIETVLTFGGSDGESWFQDLLLLQPKGDTLTWSSPSVLGTAPTVREGHACAMVGAHMYVHGGTAAGETVGDLFVLEVDNMVWIRPDAVGAAPSPRSFHTMLTIGQSLLMYGGYDGSLAEPVVHKLDTANQEWLTLSSSASSTQPPQPIFCHTATAWTEDSLLLLGGFDGEAHVSTFNRVQLSSSPQHPGTDSEAASGQAFQAAAAAAAAQQAKANEQAEKHKAETAAAKELQQKKEDQSRQEANAALERTREQNQKKEVKEQDAKDDAAETQTKATLKKQKEEEKEHQVKQSEANIELFQKREEAARDTKAKKEQAQKDREAEGREKAALQQKDLEKKKLDEEREAATEAAAKDAAKQAAATKQATNQAATRRSVDSQGSSCEAGRLSTIEDRLSSLEGLLQKVLEKLN